MPDYNINLTVSDETSDKAQTKPANKLKKQKPTQSKTQPKTMIKSNLKSTAIGISLYMGSVIATTVTLDKINSLVGDYTERRVRARRNALALRRSRQLLTLNFGKGLYDEVNADINYGIKIRKANRQSDYLKEISGITQNSGSRWRRN